MNQELASTMHKLLEDYSIGEILEALGSALQQYTSSVSMEFPEKNVGGRDYYVETMRVVNTFGVDTVLNVMVEHLEKESEEGQAFWRYITGLQAPKTE